MTGVLAYRVSGEIDPRLSSDSSQSDNKDNQNVQYTRSPSQDFRLFGPRPWTILATTYGKNEKTLFLSNPDPDENLVSGNLVMETGCTERGRARRPLRPL